MSYRFCRTPFLYACLGGQTNTVEAMVGIFLYRNVKCLGNSQILFSKFKFANSQLRSLHVDVGQVDALGCSALHCAVISGSLHCVRAVVESKVNR